MANQSDLTILQDGWRNASFRYTIALDGGSTPPLAPIVTLANFTNNDANMTALVGFRIDRIQFAVDSDISARLYWGGLTNQQLIGVFNQSEDIDWNTRGGLQPNQLLSGYDGSILMQIQGLTPSNPSGLTFQIEMVKLYKK